MCGFVGGVSVLLFFTVYTIIIVTRDSLSPVAEGCLRLQGRRSLRGIRDPCDHSVSGIGSISVISMFIRFGDTVSITLLRRCRTVINGVFRGILIISTCVPTSGLRTLTRGPRVHCIRVSRAVCRGVSRTHTVSFISSIRGKATPLAGKCGNGNIIINVISGNFRCGRPTFCSSGHRGLHLGCI